MDSMDTQTQKCNRCGGHKPVSEYVGRGGKQTKLCQKCRAQVLEYYRAHRDEQVARLRERNTAMRRRVFSKVLGGGVKQ